MNSKKGLREQLFFGFYTVSEYSLQSYFIKDASFSNSIFTL